MGKLTKRSELKKLTVMEKLITLGFMQYYTCDNETLKECVVLSETQVAGIDQIKTELNMFRKQRAIVFDDIVNENEEDVRFSIKIFKRDLEHLSKFLLLCKEGKNTIEKALFEPLKNYIETLKETIEVLTAYFD